ncbi:MAG: hypothetical protein DA328_00320 [Nitrososphaeraceae archaeon]|nr:hypothetical protein [Nitrososphaeraceae archaeon]
MDYGGYEIANEEHHGLSNRQLGLIFGTAILGIFVVFALFIFPIKNLFPELITEQVTIVSKSDGQCVVNSQDHPRGISNCNYNVGDKLEITYKYGTSQIETHKKIN